MRRLCFLILLLIAIGCKGSSVAGKYHIEQENNAFGQGAELGTLDLRDDGTFEISMGQLTLAKGNWTEEAGKVSLSSGAANMGTSYRVDGTKLIPVIGDKDVTFWRFVKK